MVEKGERTIETRTRPAVLKRLKVTEVTTRQLTKGRDPAQINLATVPPM